MFRNPHIGEGVLNPNEPERKSPLFDFPLHSYRITVGEPRRVSDATLKQIVAQIQKLTARGLFR